MVLPINRQNAIIRAVAEKHSATVSELAEIIDASESTVRRDLIELDKQGKLKKVRGGAAAVSDDFISLEPDVYTKQTLNVAEKDMIARYAAAQINKDDFVFIDAGTSTEKMIDYIETADATYVTNGIAHALKLLKKGFRTIIIGGALKPGTEAIIGANALNNLKQFNFTKAFIGTNGITVENGFTTPDIEEAQLKKEAVERSYIAFVLADHTKFNKLSAVTFSPIDKACIITDMLPDKEFAKKTVIKEVAK